MTQPTPPLLPALPVQCDDREFTGVTGVLGTEPRSAPDSGAQALMRAMVRDAIQCLQGTAVAMKRHERAKVQAEAWRWIRSSNATWLFSFEAFVTHSASTPAPSGVGCYTWHQRSCGQRPLGRPPTQRRIGSNSRAGSAPFASVATQRRAACE